MATTQMPPTDALATGYYPRADGTGPGGLAATGHTPPPQPQSKREKRRQLLAEKLADISNSFGANRKQQYHDQLRALEIDMNLIMRADPYAEQPLADDGEEIGDIINLMTGSGASAAEEPTATIGSLAGRYYAKFADEINTVMEDRDRDLTMTYNYYHNGLDDLHRTNQYKILLAQEEHAILCKTLRDRLISTVGHKRARLLKEKEQLDIADSSALLLNPSQFSLANPASPGSGHGNRKTRNTRHRPGDGDDASSAVDGNGKRKRKANEDLDNGSPAPYFRVPDHGGATPLRDTKSRLVHSQYEAPLYSIDRLFTEKELSMAMSRAHLAATALSEKARAQESLNRAAVTSGAGAASSTRNDDGAMGHASTADGDVESEAPAAIGIFAPSSPGDHAATITAPATRSSQRGNATGLGELASAAVSIPPYAINVGISASKANTAAPPPPPLTESQIRDDLADIMRKPDDARVEELLERACEKKVPIGAAMLATYLQGNGNDDGGIGMDGLNGSGVGIDAEGMALRAQVMARSASGFGGGIAMSKQSSLGGISEAGGAAMMRRSISAADFGAGAGFRGRR